MFCGRTESLSLRDALSRCLCVKYSLVLISSSNVDKTATALEINRGLE